jgi:hypothetical protein
MENQEMYKLGFELALQQAGIAKTAGVGDKLVALSKKHTPTFRRMLGFEEGSAARQSVGEAKGMMAKKYKSTGADVVRQRTKNRPALQRNLAGQPQNAFATR